MSSGLGMDFKQLSRKIKPDQWKQFQRLTKNLDLYEKRLREAVRSLDLKSQQARKVSETRLKEVSDQIKKTRGEVERRVKVLLEDEAKKLNGRLREIYSYLVKVAQKEQAAQSSVGAKKSGGRKAPAAKARQSSAAKSATQTRGAKTKSASPRKARAKSIESSQAELGDGTVSGKSTTTPIH
jgi:GTP cyclohydrolase FolE2